MRLIGNIISASVDKTFQTFFPTTGVEIVFALLPREATNFETFYHIKNLLCSPFHKDRHKTAVQLTFCTKLYMKPNRSDDICRLFCKQARTQPAVATQLSVCPSFLTDQ
jgi:hypothetical protein